MEILLNEFSGQAFFNESQGICANFLTSQNNMSPYLAQFLQNVAIKISGNYPRIDLVVFSSAHPNH